MNFYIYLITNKVNGKKYVGRTKQPRVRWGQHCRTAARGGDGVKVVHKAIAKYGAENFSFEIIGEFATEQESLDAEMAAIVAHDTRRHGYNMTDGGDGVKGAVFTPEYRARLSAAHIGKPSPRRGAKHTEECRARMREAHLGKTLPDEQKRKIGLASLGHVVSDEAKKKISDRAKLAWADPEVRARRIAGMRAAPPRDPNTVARGERLPHAKLTAEDVVIIRALLKDPEMTHAVIGKAFDVNREAICSIANGRSWRHVL